jgi:hypothetical protein
MAFSVPIQWYHSHEDPIWPDGTFKTSLLITLGGGGGGVGFLGLGLGVGSEEFSK